MASQPAFAQVVGGNGANATTDNGGAGGTTGDGSTIPSTGTTSAGSGGNGSPLGAPDSGTGASGGNCGLVCGFLNAGGGGAESGGGGGIKNGGAVGGGGGGGGARAATITGVSPTLTQTYTGGNGGNGAAGVSNGSNAFGGGGGGGGYGVVFGGTGTLTINSGANITGGNGGSGGAGTSSNTADGNGGAGGDGLLVTSAGATVLVNAVITGGNGGTTNHAVAGAVGSPGAGGAGIVGGNLAITIGGTGSVSGGLANGGAGARANAVTFTGGTNSIELQFGSNITGNVVAFSTADTFRLGGSAGASFDVSAIGAAAQYRGFGNFEKTGTSQWVLTGTTTAVTPWKITQGSLFVTADGALGATSGGLTLNGGTLETGGTFTSNRAVTLTNAFSTISVDPGTTLTLTGQVSGLGFIKQGTGTLILAGANINTVGAGLAQGTIQVQNNSALGTDSLFMLSGTTLQSGTAGLSIANDIRFNFGGNFTIDTQANSMTLLGVVGEINPGTLVKTGSGALILTNSANSYSGGTLLNAGTIQVGANAALGTGGLAMANGTTLQSGAAGLGIANNIAIIGTGTVDSNGNAMTLSGVISGGGLTKTGAGLINLTATNTYTGPTTVNGGTLAVNGSIASSSLTTVNAGATLGGNGTVGNTTINGGALAPGNSIGLLTVQGNLVFTAASSYMVEVSPTNADRTNVTGTATLGGATVRASFAPGTYVAKQYTILNAAGGVNGTFSGPVNTNLPGGFTPSLSYDTNNAYLNLALTFVPPPGSGLTGNQASVGNAIVNFFNTTGGIPIVFGGLTPAGLTQISGETATGSQQTTFDAMNLFMGLLTDPFITGRGDPISAGGAPNAYADESLAYAAKRKPNDALAAIYTKAPPPPVRSFEQRWSVWAAGYGGSQRTDGNTVLGSNDTRSSIGGGAVGADYRFSPNTIAGFALAGGGTNFSVNGFGSGRSDLFQAGAFVRHNAGPAYVTGALAYGWQDVTTDRIVTVAGIDRLRAQFNANAWSGRLEGGYRFVNQGFGWTPYAAAQFTTFELPNYAEQAIVGSNQFALAYTSKSVTDTRTELGLRTDKSFAMVDGIFTLRGRAAWAHDYNPDRAIGATFQTLPGASFVVNGARRAPDSALLTGSAEMKWINGWSVAGTFEGEFSNVTQSYAGKGVVRYAW